MLLVTLFPVSITAGATIEHNWIDDCSCGAYKKGDSLSHVVALRRSTNPAASK